MPITQDRVMRLINTAIDYKQAGETLCKKIHNYQLYPDTTAEQILIDLKIAANMDILLEHPSASATTLALEHKHFQRNYRRNAREAFKMAIRRAPNFKPLSPLPEPPPQPILKELDHATLHRIQEQTPLPPPKTWMPRLRIEPGLLPCPYCSKQTNPKLKRDGTLMGLDGVGECQFCGCVYSFEEGSTRTDIMFNPPEPEQEEHL